MDVLHHQIRIVGQGLAAGIEYVIGVQEFVTERREIASLEGGVSQTERLSVRKRLNPYRFRDQRSSHPIEYAEPQGPVIYEGG